MDPSSVTLTQLESAYRKAPESRLFASLADAYRASGRLPEALDLLQEGTQRHPDYVSALVLLGLCQRELAGGEAAEITFARVLWSCFFNLSKRSPVMCPVALSQ